MDILEWIQAAKKFNIKEMLNSFSFYIIDDEKITDLQRQQWSEGRDSKGRIIGFYKKRTEEITNGKKIAGEPYNLLDSGDFWANAFIIVRINDKDLEFEFNSSGIHKDKLFQTIQFSGEISNPEDIFGLMEPSKEVFVKMIEPKFVEQLEKYYNNV